MGAGRKSNLYSYRSAEMKKASRKVVGDWRYSMDSRLLRVTGCAPDDSEGRKDGSK